MLTFELFYSHTQCAEQPNIQLFYYYSVNSIALLKRYILSMGQIYNLQINSITQYEQ